MQEKARIFKSSWYYSRFLIHFSIRKKWPILCLRISVLQSKQVIFIRWTPTYLRCIADQTRSKYDQPTLYRRPPRFTPAHHTTCGERDHPRPFSTGWKKIIPLTTTLRADPTNPAVFKTNIRSPRSRPAHCRSVHFSRAGESGGWSALWSSKMEKVPRGIQGEKSRKDTASSVKLVSTIGA